MCHITSCAVPFGRSACQHGTVNRVLALLPAAAVTMAAVFLAACTSDPNEANPSGAALSKQYGCAACHGSHGEGGVGPKWVGLYGSTVTLSDGTTTVVDRAYLERAITEPDAQIPNGVTVKMPKSNLSDAAVQSLVDYIISLK